MNYLSAPTGFGGDGEDRRYISPEVVTASMSLRTEAHVRSVHVGTRIAPTPEDAQIFARTVRRIARWSKTEHKIRVQQMRGVVSTKEMLANMQRAVLDLTHFPPP